MVYTRSFLWHFKSPIIYEDCGVKKCHLIREGLFCVARGCTKKTSSAVQHACIYTGIYLKFLEKIQFHLALHRFQTLPHLATWGAAFTVHHIPSAHHALNLILFILNFAAASIKLCMSLCGILSSHWIRCRGQDRKRLFRQYCFCAYSLHIFKYKPWKWWVFFFFVKNWHLGSHSDFMCTRAQLISVDLLQIYVALGEGPSSGLILGIPSIVNTVPETNLVSQTCWWVATVSWLLGNRCSLRVHFR